MKTDDNRTSGRRPPVDAEPCMIDEAAPPRTVQAPVPPSMLSFKRDPAQVIHGRVVDAAEKDDDVGQSAQALPKSQRRRSSASSTKSSGKSGRSKPASKKRDEEGHHEEDGPERCVIVGLKKHETVDTDEESNTNSKTSSSAVEEAEYQQGDKEKEDNKQAPRRSKEDRVRTVVILVVAIGIVLLATTLGLAFRTTSQPSLVDHTPFTPPPTMAPLGMDGAILNTSAISPRISPPDDTPDLAATLAPSPESVLDDAQADVNSAVLIPDQPFRPDCPRYGPIRFATKREPPPMMGKKGIGMRLPEENPAILKRNIERIKELRVNWNYSWNLNRVALQPNFIEFIPMVWGKWSGNTFRTQLQALASNGKIKRVLGFNEPDYKVQSNMQVDEAVSLWPDLEATNLPLVSPSAADPGGDWMQDFMTKARAKCHRVDYVGVHWYGDPNPGAFKNKMREFYALNGGVPLMITEFAPADWSAKTPQQNKFSRGEVLKFMKEVLPWLESQAWIAGYAWFNFENTNPVGTCSSLYNDDTNRLTPLGLYYASVTSSKKTGDQTITMSSKPGGGTWE